MTNTSRAAQSQLPASSTSPMAVSGARKIAQGSSTVPMNTLPDKNVRRLSRDRPSSFYENSQGSNSYYNMNLSSNNIPGNSGIFGSMNRNMMLTPTPMAMGKNLPAAESAMNSSSYNKFSLAGSRHSSVGSINMYSGLLPPSSMMPEEVIVTKIFSSRRDLDRMASGLDFPRQMSFMWSTYKSMYSEDYGLTRLYSHGSQSSVSTAGDPTNRNEQSNSSIYDHNRSFAAMDDLASGVKNKNNVSFVTSPAATSASRQTDMASRGVGPTGANEAGEANKTRGRQSTEDASDGVDLTDYVASLMMYGNATSSVSGIHAKEPNKTENKENTNNLAKRLTPMTSTQSASSKPDTVKSKTNASTIPLDRDKKYNADSSNLNGSTKNTNSATQLKPQSLTAIEEVDRVPRKDIIQKVIDSTTQSIANATAPSENNATQSRGNPNHKKNNIKVSQLQLPEESPHKKLESEKNQATHNDKNQIYTSSVNEHLNDPTTSEPTRLMATKREEDKDNSVCDLSSLNDTSLNNSLSGYERNRGRNLSRRPSRRMSRTTSFNDVDFPVADEVDDDLVKNQLEDVLQSAEEEHRAQERDAAKQAMQETKQRQRELTERAVKAHELALQQRRSANELAETQRREQIARLDEARRREREQALAAQAKEREMAKQEFLQRQREQEQQRYPAQDGNSSHLQRRMSELPELNNLPVLSAIENSNNNNNNKIHSGPSNNRHKPTEPIGSTLRGVIPAQPPDVIADQVEDTMADGLSSMTRTNLLQQHYQHPQSENEEKKEKEALGEMASSKEFSTVQPSSAEKVNASLQEKATNGRNAGANGNIVDHSRTNVQNTAMEPHAATNSSTSPSFVKNTDSTSMNNNNNNNNKNEHKDNYNKSKENVSKDRESAMHAAPKPNLVRTVVLYDEFNTAAPFKIQNEELSYKDETCVVKETMSVDQMHNCLGHKNDTNNNVNRSSDEAEHTNKRNSSFQRVLEAVCNGYNAALLSLDLPNNSKRFQSPIWEVLKWIVSEVEREHATTENVVDKVSRNSSSLPNASTNLINNINNNVSSGGRSKLGMNIEIDCALAYFNDNEVLDLFSANSNEEFKQVSFEPSPIYGPRVKQLTYEPVTSSTQFTNRLDAAMCRAAENVKMSQLTSGTVVAYLLLKQVFPLPESMQHKNNVNDAINEASANSLNIDHDVFLSSLTVACAGDDVTPFETAADRTRTCYGEAFHIVLGGPCYTVFALNIINEHNNVNDIKTEININDANYVTKVQKIFALLKRLTTYENYALRSGSIRRFIRYVERAKAEGMDRVSNETDSTRRSKIDRYLKEQQRLIDTATKMLQNPASMGVR